MFIHDILRACCIQCSCIRHRLHIRRKVGSGKGSNVGHGDQSSKYLMTVIDWESVTVSQTKVSILVEDGAIAVSIALVVHSHPMRAILSISNNSLHITELSQLSTVMSSNLWRSCWWAPCWLTVKKTFKANKREIKFPSQSNLLRQSWW